MAESLFNLNGSQPTKQYKNVPISTSNFFSGLWTQRSPFGSPDSRYYNKVLGGRTDILIDGLNTELTNYGTLIRRPGNDRYSSVSLGSTPLTFYSFHPIGQTISVIADTVTAVSILTPTTNTSIFTKSLGAGQTYFQGVGSTLYMGNGTDQKAYPNGGTVRNWGITLSGTSSAAVAGTGVNGGFGHPIWANPSNVSSAVSFASVAITNSFGVLPPPLLVVPSNPLNATNFGFAVTNNPTGIQVAFDCNIDGDTGAQDGSFFIQLLQAGTPVGNVKIINATTATTTFTLGGTGDLWGATWSASDINNAAFGVQIIANLSSFDGVAQTRTLSVRDVNVTISIGVGAPVVSLLGGGALTATVGYEYIYSYFNSASGAVSNPTLPSVLIKPVGQNVQITLVASADPQVTGIKVFRTKDGGTADFFELPNSPFQNISGDITDSNLDATLQLTSFFPADIPWLANSPPPAGLVKMAYHLNRMWGVVNNNVYFSALLGDDITLGVGVESWPPSNVFVFPETVNRLMPIASGLLIFTTDDVWLISGTTRTSLFSQLFQQGVGLLSWNSLDVEGNQIFMYTSDRQFISFSASGPNEIGYPIGVDIQTNFNPANTYVAALIAGTQDKAVFLADGTSTWYRCNWNQPPEGGPAWCPLASITSGATAVVSVETSPGTHQLLIGQSTGTVLTRNYSSFSDNGVAYSAFATIGSLILAKPGQLAALESIILELKNVGSIPTISLLLDEISGTFEQLISSVTDPPNLVPSNSVMSRRWYLSQGQASTFCRHIQLKVSFAAEVAKNELLTVSEVGAVVSDK